MWFDVVSWFVPLLNALGLYLAVLKRKEAFLVFTVTNVYWFVYHVLYRSYHFCPVLVMYQVLNTWGYFRWKREREVDRV